MTTPGVELTPLRKKTKTCAAFLLEESSEFFSEFFVAQKKLGEKLGHFPSFHPSKNISYGFESCSKISPSFSSEFFCSIRGTLFVIELDIFILFL